MRTGARSRVFPTRSIGLFLLFVVALSAPLDWLLIHADKMDAAHGFVIHAAMWVPGIAAIIVCLLTTTPLAALGWRWPDRRWLILGYLLPVAYAVPASAIGWLTGLASATFADFAEKVSGPLGIGVPGALLTIVLTLTYGVIQSAASATGEEIGWRGFLVPALAERMPFAAMALVSGLIWAAWHMPLILFADYNSAAPWPVAVACFTVMIVATGALAAWLRLKSASLWPATLLHATHNALIQWVLDPMTVETGRSAWFAGEFGVLLAATSVVVALLVLRRGKPT